MLSGCLSVGNLPTGLRTAWLRREFFALRWVSYPPAPLARASEAAGFCTLYSLIIFLCTGVQKAS
jgi:hypothetical protein